MTATHDAAAPTEAGDELVDQLVPGASPRRAVLVGLVVLALLFALTVVPTDSFRASYNDWRHTGTLQGRARAVEGPLELRSQPATVALGDGRVLVWGGRNVSPDSGNIYDPADGTWEHIPAAPAPARFDAAAVWTGEEAVIWGGSTNASAFDFDPGGVAYDPATATWRELPDAPIGLHGGRAVAYDDGVLIAGGQPQRSDAGVVSLWLDLATDTWSVVPAPVVVLNTAWDGDRLLATGPTSTGMGRMPASGWPVVAFDPVARRWEQVADPIETQWMALAVADDGTLTAVTLAGLNEPLRAYAWDGATWTQVAETERGAGPITTIEVTSYPPATVWTGERLLMGGSGGLTEWDPATGRFATVFDRVLRNFGTTAVWTGTEAVALTNQSSEGWVWTPAPD